MNKKCTQCKETKSIRLFYRDSKKTDGLMPHCRDCHRKRRVEFFRNPRNIRLRSEYQNKYYFDNKDIEKKKSKERYQKHKKELTELLGGICVRCGFTDKRVLQVDHINGGGSKHFRIKGSSYRMYREIIESVKNKENNYQLLCSNCNLIEAFEKGYKKTIWT